MIKKPKLCLTKTGVYYVWVNRKKVYLGKGDPDSIEIKYNAFLHKLNSGVDSCRDNDAPVTIVELSAQFLSAHKNYYARGAVKQDKQLARFKTALSVPLSLFPSLPADEFGARRLIEVRDAMVASERFCRAYINALVVCLRHVFSWGVEQELVKPETLVALRAVSPLRRGRTDARELPPVRSVPSEVVEATLPFLPTTVAAIVSVQRHTGMRPSEVLNMRVRDLRETPTGYAYTLEADKTDYRRVAGDKRVVNLGSRAAAVVRQYLKNRQPDAYVFCSNPKTNTPYKPTSYGRAISRAAKQAGVPHWSPYRLRHLFATEVRAQFGLEAAQTVLGHKNADVTQIYAERDNALAEKVASRLG